MPLPTNIAAPIQWGVDVLLSQLGKIEERARVERSQIYLNTAHLKELDLESRKITDPAKRAALRSWLERSFARQREISALYQGFSNRLGQLAGQVRAFLAAHGIKGSGGLSGLGVVPLVVPVALVALAASAWAAVAYIGTKNAPQTKGIQLQRETLAALAKSGATAEQILEAAKAGERAVAAMQPPPGDPLGLSELARTLTPLALIVAAALILPGLLRALPRRAAA